MARRTDGRVDSTRRTKEYRQDAFEDGNAVRHLAQPLEQPEEQPEQSRTKVSRQTRRNRARATQMRVSFVLFLGFVCTASIFGCVEYMKLKTMITTQTEDIASKEKELSDLKADNDAYYNTVIASQDIEAIKEAAENRLGMKYADQSQIIYFHQAESNYVRQYQDVPGTE